MLTNSEVPGSFAPPEPKIKIVIADDHRLVREGLSYLLNAESDMEVVGWAADGLEAIELVRKCQPDVILMDLQMPNLNGLETIRRLKGEDSTVKIIILTIYDTDEHIIEGLRAGARGYFLKDVPKEELYQAIRQLSRGQPLTQPTPATWFSNIIAESEVEPTLTARELEILKLMAIGDRNKEIASKLAINETVAKGYIISLFQKLGVADRSEAVRYALQKGW